MVTLHLGHFLGKKDRGHGRDTVAGARKLEGRGSLSPKEENSDYKKDRATPCAAGGRRACPGQLDRLQARPKLSAVLVPPSLRPNQDLWGSHGGQNCLCSSSSRQQALPQDGEASVQALCMVTRRARRVPLGFESPATQPLASRGTGSQAEKGTESRGMSHQARK